MINKVGELPVRTVLVADGVFLNNNDYREDSKRAPYLKGIL